MIKLDENVHVGRVMKMITLDENNHAGRMMKMITLDAFAPKTVKHRTCFGKGSRTKRRRIVAGDRGSICSISYKYRERERKRERERARARERERI